MPTPIDSIASSSRFGLPFLLHLLLQLLIQGVQRFQAAFKHEYNSREPASLEQYAAVMTPLELERERLERQLPSFNNPAQFSEYTKMKRRVAELGRRIEAEDLQRPAEASKRATELQRLRVGVPAWTWWGRCGRLAVRYLGTRISSLLLVLKGLSFVLGYVYLLGVPMKATGPTGESVWVLTPTPVEFWYPVRARFPLSLLFTTGDAFVGSLTNMGCMWVASSAVSTLLDYAAPSYCKPSSQWSAATAAISNVLTSAGRQSL